VKTRPLTFVVMTMAGAALAAGRHTRVVDRPRPPSVEQTTEPTTSTLAIASLDRKLADLDAEEQASKKELSGLGPRIRAAHDRAVVRGRALYKLTRAGLLPIGGGFDSLMRHAMDVEHARHALERDLREEQRLRARSADVAHSIERVGRDRESLVSQRAAMEAARQALDDEERRQRAFDRAFTSSTGGGNDYVIVGRGVDPSGAVGFSASRGKLLFPVAGRADVRNGHLEGTDGPGVEIMAASGSVVRAVYAGKVAFADRYGAYGRLVILDHGEHYYSVSGNLGSIDAKIGDDVAAGERIGTVGDSESGGMMYFEIRHGSLTVPPGPWLGI
jgi:murein DD-endopeptidase MepM/ murein hydrolase activator NlpD